MAAAAAKDLATKLEIAIKPRPINWLHALASLGITVVGVGAFGYVWKHYLDPFAKQDREAADARKRFINRSSTRNLTEVTLSSYESLLLDDVVFPEDIEVDFDDIGGLDDIKSALQLNIMLPLERPELFGSSSLRKAPKGMLFYGPPGTGKTMVAKALAKASQYVFINLDISKMIDKYYGETQKYISALFSLAQKLSPAIIFIDEVDSVLFARSGTTDSHSSFYAQVTAQFLQLWDGLTTDQSAQVIVLGATNRPQVLDEAIQRRMPHSFHFKLPDFEARLKILEVTLREELLEPDLDLKEIAKASEGYSGSDLGELCRTAAMLPVRKLMARSYNNLKLDDGEKSDTVGITRSDFLEALDTVRPTGEKMGTFTRDEATRQAINNSESVTDDQKKVVNDIVSGVANRFLRALLQHSSIATEESVNEVTEEEP